MDNATYRFGEAEFASREEIAAGGYFHRSPNSLFIGFFGPQPLWYDGLAGWLIVAGARSGKLRDLLGYISEE